jgi:hypothetical protein
MKDILEFQTVIDYAGSLLQIKGKVDSPDYWLTIRVQPYSDFWGQTELFVCEEDIITLITELNQAHKETKGRSTLKCAGWGSYITFDLQK